MNPALVAAIVAIIGAVAAGIAQIIHARNGSAHGGGSGGTNA